MHQPEILHAPSGCDEEEGLQQRNNANLMKKEKAVQLSLSHVGLDVSRFSLAKSQGSLFITNFPVSSFSEDMHVLFPRKNLNFHVSSLSSSPLPRCWVGRMRI